MANSKFISSKITFNGMIYKLIFFIILYCSIISITIKQSPIAKKLNNGKYIVVSSIGISFLDEALIEESKHIPFDDEINTRESIIEQFPIEDDGYIIIFLNNVLYFLSENETIINKVENITFNDNNNNFYSIVPYGHSLNEYYFALIFSNNEKLIYKKGIFNSISEDISFSERSEFNTSYVYLINYFRF